MSWYVYRQNNSGGVFKAPAIAVAVEAPNKREAWRQAKAAGLDPRAPFCPCCGERWRNNPTKLPQRPTFDDVFGKDQYGFYQRWSERDGVPLMKHVSLTGEG